MGQQGWRAQLLGDWRGLLNPVCNSAACPSCQTQADGGQNHCKADMKCIAAADPIIAALEYDPEKSIPGYSKDKKGQWTREVPGQDPQRYCSTCHIWRPPRASHCSECGYCMVCFQLALTTCKQPFTASLLTGQCSNGLFCQHVPRLAHLPALSQGTWTRCR